MSPLARSLLALAALLAAADATSNPFCDGLIRGEETDSYETFVISARGDEVTTIPDRITRPGRQLVGDSLYACNAPYSRPKLDTPMGIAHPLSAVYITCPKNVLGCLRLELHVTQYGKVVGPPPQPLISPGPGY